MPSQNKEMQQGAHSAPKGNLADRAASFLYRNGLVAGIGAAVLVAGVFAVTLWFTVFSGLSSSADFIYAQF